jgi:triosephosphate isomerase (TIM)
MADRMPLMAGNWKMHHNHLEAIQVVQKLSYRLDDKDYKNVEVVVCPAFTALRSVQTTLEGDRIPIGLGAQNCHWEPQGAFTGEVSAPMLAKLNVRYVIVGHSERRELFGETDEMVARKVRAVLGTGMSPIVCVGETLQEREDGVTDEKVSRQVRAALAGLSGADVGRCVVAYEPIWAIGTGLTPTPADVEQVHGSIRESLVKRFSEGARIRILYGGSVKPSNAAELMAIANVNGALVGGASLKAADFLAIAAGC